MTTDAQAGTSVPLAQRTLPAMLQQQAERFGDRPLLSVAGHSWAHRDAMQAASRRAASLRRAGVARGDRVAVMSSNRIEFLEVFLACGWLGAVAVPINTASMGPQIQYYLANSGTRLLVIEAALLERLRTADLAATALQTIWVVDAPADLRAEPDSAVRLEPYPADDATAIEAAPVGPGDPLAILYTSGTTGPAKGVSCPHAQYHGWGTNTADVLGVVAADVLCTTLPLFHINALNTYAQAAVTGARVVFEPRFSASGFWPAMHRTQASVVYLLGAMVPILLAQPVTDGERGHRVRVGLGPGVPAAAGRAFLERSGVPLLEGYGSTETNFVIATRLPAGEGGDARGGGTMGWLRPGFEARVADEHDAELPTGVAGELLLRADEPYAFATDYFNMPQQTLDAWRNLWFHTGDRVVREADGAFRFVDRLKDAIRRRGENISSFEVEQVLLSHPGVAAAAVYPVRSELAEDEVMASLIARPDHVLDPAELARFCEARLPYFAVPRYVDVVADLPRTENGKVQKFRLRESGVTATTWDRGGAPTRPRAAAA
jgi:crotonobetaine/carnitine-CoA ligase